jgi:hypothetical protein
MFFVGLLRFPLINASQHSFSYSPPGHILLRFSSKFERIIWRISVKYSVGHLIAYMRFAKTEIILAKAVSEWKWNFRAFFYPQLLRTTHDFLPTTHDQNSNSRKSFRKLNHFNLRYQVTIALPRRPWHTCDFFFRAAAMQWNWVLIVRKSRGSKNVLNFQFSLKHCFC